MSSRDATVVTRQEGTRDMLHSYFREIQGDMLHALPCESFGLGLAAEPSLERKDGLSEDDLEAGKDACARRGVKATQLRGGTSTSGGYKWGSMGDTWELVRENACDYTSCGRMRACIASHP